MNTEKGLLFLTGIFCSLIVLSNIIASKLVNIGPLIVPIAVFFYPFTFAATDIVSEVYGKGSSKTVVWVGFIANTILLLVSWFVVTYPPAPIFSENEAFVHVFGGVPRLILASVLAYLCSQFHDVWAFHFWKRATSGLYLAIRSVCSTAVSQLLDTLIFISVAFIGTVPFEVLRTMILSQYTVKFILTFVALPIVYLGVKIITGTWEVREIRE